ncbi:MAG: 4Fe-4S dicluster domain-containing protein [Oscillospiraceae bacterium]|jgi:2-oxoglutarate ferredoxin oxidoreductase subunit delta|nr:4Fe-4S dicluster domain-containing protein [Oscillospiraceae bacterium]
MKTITFDEERCKGCGLCITVCPKKIITLEKEKINKKGYNPAGAKEPDLCISCAQCAIICPDVAIRIENGK